MNDGMLSQEEIEALLRGESLEENNNEPESSSTEELRVEDYLSPMEQDALGEVGNISFGSSATALSALLGQKVDITTPVVSMINRNRLEEEFPQPYVAVQVEYTIGLVGMNLLVIKQTDAAIIADLMLGGDGLNPKPELGEIQLSAVQEAMNQMMGSAATSMSTIFNKKVDISPPSIDLLNFQQNEGHDNIPQEDLLVKVSFRLKIGELIDSNIMQLLPLNFSKDIVKTLLGEPGAEVNQPVAEQPAQVSSAPVQQTQQQNTTQQPMNQPATQEPIHSQQAAATVFEEPPIFSTPRYQQPPQQNVNVQQAQFAAFEQPNITQSEARNLNMLLDIPLQVTVELGRTKHSVKEILQLSTGSIIELDKLAGEPVDILVNNRLIAKGEVVVIDENFGVRITDIVSQADRLNNLR
ncbi:flagellar motor switch protein FliN [Ureibacillus massiliensis 4400831 = CIP 108448 = CCUG 49529]|uniref:Flagellar motor switch protein FliN n=1 Tax=Ureibacillus massiliensis 4400831 = CIP 108448 = CCUG 49529 TaxID=1211035 RepID=A0A0A3J552_9BACL|nr:flagellar motor switch phosphatase FliY [Ureibacillus massiliensis]KGR92066.1 flagellar motor switch protein FliN [Ureibacillus massiliensis 4400831 = CIP 108448 = CCUG 49529]